MTPSPDPLAAARPRAWARRLLALAGWTLDLSPPPGPKALLIVYPHTSNWDFLVGILTKWACGWPVRWIGKHTLFVGPFDRLLRSWGGMPVNRQAPGGFIQGLAAEVRAAQTLIIAMSPEGTRTYLPYWKSGFLRLAQEAGLPVGLVRFDYATRRVDIAAYLVLSGDTGADMARIAAAYRGVRGKVPHNMAPICLKGGASASSGQAARPGGPQA